MTLLYRRCLHFLYTIQNNHSLFYFSVSQKHPRFRLAILIYNLEMWRSYCNMKTAAWNYDDLWLGSAFSNGVFNTTLLIKRWHLVTIGIISQKVTIHQLINQALNHLIVYSFIQFYLYCWSYLIPSYLIWSIPILSYLFPIISYLPIYPSICSFTTDTLL